MTELEQLPFAKPSKRIVDKRAITAYARTFRQCEIIRCASSRNTVETHHIVSRKMGGSDIPSNLLRLCGFGGHHTEWHTVGGKEFFRRYGDLLSDEARAKVAVALRLDEGQPK